MDGDRNLGANFAFRHRMGVMDDYVLTYEGIGQAIQILSRDGLLDTKIAPKDVQEGFAVLDTKATTFLTASRAKGDARSQQELDEAQLIALFKLWIEGYVRVVVAAEA